MSVLGPGIVGIAGKHRNRVVGTAVALCAAVALAGCSTTVYPKTAAVGATSATKSSAPVKQTTTTKAATATTPVVTATDVDHTVCEATRTEVGADQEKAANDRADAKKVAADLKAAGSALYDESLKTKVDDLKSTLQKMSGYYDTLATEVLDSKPTDVEYKNIADEGPHLNSLCPQTS
jgi:hypothetical protein